MIRDFCLVAFLIVLVACSVANAQPGDDLEARKNRAFQLFHQGKVKQAIAALATVIQSVADVPGRVVLQRDLLEVCAFGHDWNCVAQTIQEMLPTMRADQRLRGDPL
jgi:hypothetical protein